jgi:signal transduction histidine kinase
MASSRATAWERRLLPTVTVVPYVLLAILVAVTVALKHAAVGSLLIDLALCAGLAGWLLWMITLHPGWRTRPEIMGLFMAGLIALMAVLVVRDPWFGFFAIAGYFLAFRLIPWPWQLAGVAAVAVIAATAQASGITKATAVGLVIYFAIIAANVLPMCGAAWVGWNEDKYSNEREQALNEVQAAKEQLEATLAENAALQKQLVTRAREAGVVDERQRLAREIHDTLAQGLTGIITQLQAAEHADHDPAARRRHFAAATQLARDSLSEARRSVHELRPEPLETARLGEALAGVAERWSAIHGIATQVTTTGEVRPMQPDAEVALLRAAQEALANVAKHANATRVGITLSFLEHEVALDVRDDGDGFELSTLDGDADGNVPNVDGATAPRVDDAALGTGFGLVAMRQRIEGMSGTLQVESEPGVGTAISARVPMTAAAAS